VVVPNLFEHVVVVVVVDLEIFVDIVVLHLLLNDIALVDM
jgi:hypothetical protein